MKFRLNTEKFSFRIIGDYVFTYDDPEHDINIDDVNDNILKQLMYNRNIGVLDCDDYQQLVDKWNNNVQPEIVIPPPQQIPVQTPVQKQPQVDPIAEEKKALNKILKFNTNTIKKQAREMSIGRVRRLLELELQQKKRKGLVSFLNDLLSAHAKQVIDDLDIEDVQGKFHSPGVKTSSPIVTDIVESDIEDVEINLE